MLKAALGFLAVAVLVILSPHIMPFLEWGGAALVVLGYYSFGRQRIKAGALFSVLAGVVLSVWAIQGEHWGVFVLNLTVLLVNGNTIRKMER